MSNNPYSEVTPKIFELAKECAHNNHIDKELYAKHKVNLGLRDVNGQGILTGLTEISDIISFEEKENGERIPCEGILKYRGYDIYKLVDGFMEENRFGFEEITYLLLLGKLPTREELADFTELLASYRKLPKNFVRDVILKAPSREVMNTMARCVLTMYVYDDMADNIAIPNVLRQSLQLVSQFPIWAVYGYLSSQYYHYGNDLHINQPRTDLSTAENILHMLRPDGKYTDLEAKILDLALVLHAEHGGGNNSTFTAHVVSSSGTDTYSAIAAALGSLKGPKHGGANIKVVRMFNDIKENVKDWTNEEEIAQYLTAILEKRAFDRTGLIYGMGHAVYSISDPRACILERCVKDLSAEKGRDDEYALYKNVAKIGTKLISEKRKIYKGVSPNVDFFSGFVYSMLNIPAELLTPIFAIARIVGWSAHRIEGLINADKIIRPGYMGVGEAREYTKIDDRN